MKVISRRLQTVRVMEHLPKARIARGTKDSPYASRLPVMVHMHGLRSPGRCATANGATSTLAKKHGVVVFDRHPVLSLQSPFPVTGVVLFSVLPFVCSLSGSDAVSVGLPPSRPLHRLTGLASSLMAVLRSWILREVVQGQVLVTSKTLHRFHKPSMSKSESRMD